MRKPIQESLFPIHTPIFLEVHVRCLSFILSYAKVLLALLEQEIVKYAKRGVGKLGNTRPTFEGRGSLRHETSKQSSCIEMVIITNISIGCNYCNLLKNKMKVPQV